MTRPPLADLRVLTLTYATLGAVNPAVVRCSLSEFGRTGPRAADHSADPRLAQTSSGGRGVV